MPSHSVCAGGPGNAGTWMETLRPGLTVRMLGLDQASSVGLFLEDRVTPDSHFIGRGKRLHTVGDIGSPETSVVHSVTSVLYR